MNKLTLTFSDSVLESKYQDSQKSITIQGFKYNITIPILSYFINGIYWATQSFVILSVAYFILSIIYSFVLYKMVIKKEWDKYSGFIMASFSLVGIVIQFIPVWDKHLTSFQISWIEDTSILMGMHISISSHLLLNVALYALFIATRIYLRSLNPLCIIFFLYVFLAFYNQYERVKSLRYQFLWKQKNQNQFFVFDDLIKESLIILNYNSEWDKFTVAFANKQFLSEYHDGALEFIKELQLSQHKMSALTYLHYRIYDSRNQFCFDAFWKNRSQHIQIECWKYSIIDTQIILKLQTKKAYSQNIYPLLYKGILKKLKKIDKQQYHTESLKNLLGALLIRPSSILNVKIQSLNYNQLSALLMNLLRDNAALFTLNLKSEQFHTNIPLLYILMISISKYYIVSRFSLNQLDESILEITVKGAVKKLNDQNKSFFEKLIGILVDLIGIQQLRMDTYNFSCRIINMESPFISTMN